MAVTVKTMADLRARMLADTLWLRAEFFRLAPSLTESELATLVERSGGDAKSLVQQCRDAGKIFWVSRNGDSFCPALQFGPEAKPYPAIGEILKIFRQASTHSDWDNAFWFIGAKGWLDDPSPLEKLFTEPNLVMHAAEQEVAPYLE